MMNEAIAAELVEELKQQHKKIASAESLTGGMISQFITGVPGASEVFECGICSYSNRIKQEVLGVSEETLLVDTEYSRQCAAQMAQGVCRLSGADIGLSTTGIAGPGGGTEEKPVGLVYVAVSNGNHSIIKELHLGSDAGSPQEHQREQIRRMAAYEVLKMALLLLQGKITFDENGKDSGF
ncbi:MAG: CinA family protein [Clostridia bacterium]|nr:CinA family protein [Clostridia bacterium]